METQLFLYIGPYLILILLLTHEYIFDLGRSGPGEGVGNSDCCMCYDR